MSPHLLRCFYKKSPRTGKQISPSHLHFKSLCAKKAEMATSLEMCENCKHVRSISMPSRTHPHVLQVEEEMNKLKTWEACSKSSLKKKTICSSLGGARDLDDCIEDLLHLPATQLGLSSHYHGKWIDEISDGLVRLMDMCGTVRDFLAEIKENVQALQFSLRRRGQESCMEGNVNAYIHSRKKMKKDISKCLTELKQSESRCASFPLISSDQHLVMVVRVLREVQLITIAVLEAIFLFLTASRPNPKPSRWSLISKLVHKGLAACEGDKEDMNEMQSVDVALQGLRSRVTDKDAQLVRAHTVNKQLEALKIGIEEVESGLECMFRRLIQTRVSLLNILTP